MGKKVHLDIDFFRPLVLEVKDIAFLTMVHTALEYFKSSPKRVVGLLIFVLVLVSIPVTVALVKQNQELRKKAAEEKKEEVVSPKTEFVSNQLLVKFKKEARGKVKEGNPQDTGLSSIDKIHKQFKVKSFEKVAKKNRNSDSESEFFGWYKIILEGNEEKIRGRLGWESNKLIPVESDDQKTNFFNSSVSHLQALIGQLKSDSSVEAVDLNYIVVALAVPNDPYYYSIGTWGQAYPDLWGMKKINLEPAWDQTTGSDSIIVADVDTGVDRNHEDLKDNMWVNDKEVPNNGIDDDNNGYTDDYFGWDFFNKDNDPMDDHGHGTHTVGTIAGVGNNGLGVVGVNWNARIMAVKFLSSSGSGSLDDGAKALQYAADMGARVSSNSWGCNCQSLLTDDAVKYEHDKGMVILAAAANSNADALGFSPASADYAMTIAASDQNDIKASFSNFGEKIDVAAPGVDILSARATNNPMCTADRTVGTDYCRVSGTSMATPHVAGLAALLWSKNPTLSNEQIRQIIRNGAVDLGNPGKDPSFGYGRIDANGSMLLVNSDPLAPIITSPQSRTVVFGTNLQILGSVSGSGFSNYKIEVGSGRAPTSWLVVASSSTQVINGVLATLDTTKLPEGLNIFRLTAADTGGKTYQFQIHDVEVDNFDATITSPGLGGLVSQGTIDVVGSAQAKNGLAFADYKLEWGEGSSPASWLTSGITLVSGGTQPVTSGLLGTWDTSTFVDGQTYALRLTVKATNGIFAQFSITVKADKDLVKGWPKTIDTTGWDGYVSATPAIADLDGDGTKEVVILAPAGEVLAFKKDGNMLPGFPATSGTEVYFQYSPNIADLDNDGKKEIVSSSGGMFCERKIYITRSDGTLQPGWPNPTFGSCGDITPSVADLNGDGKKELLFIEVAYTGDVGIKLHVLTLDGTELSGFPKKLSSNVAQAMPGPVSISDLDSDGTVEIAVGARNNEFYLLDNNGNVLPGWPSILPSIDGKQIEFRSPPGVGDVDGDGVKEIFALGLLGSCGGCDAVLYGWKNNGTLLPAFGPKREGTLFYGAGDTNTPSFADVDNDGKDEVAVGVYSLRVYDGDGTTKIKGGVSASVAPSISDVDGDGKLEFISVYSNTVKIFDDNGDDCWSRQFSGAGMSFLNPAVLSDIDMNGRMELAVAQSISKEGTAMLAYLWELPNTGANPSDGWPQFGYDEKRSSRLVYFAPPSTPVPTPTLTSIPTVPPTPISSPFPSPTPPAQNYGGVTGTVYSSAGGTVTGVKITMRVGKTNRIYYSNTLGYYSITNLPAGTYSLTFQAKGYVNQKAQVVVTAGSSAVRDIILIER